MDFTLFYTTELDSLQELTLSHVEGLKTVLR